MARFLLLSRSNDHKTLILDTGSREMDKALHLVATLHDEEVEGEIKTVTDVNRAFGRLGHWQLPLQTHRGSIIGRGHLLFIEIPKAISLPYDLDGKMKEYFNLNVFEFIASGIAAWAMSTGVLKYKLTIEVDALKNIVTTDTLDRFVELSSGTPEDYRRLIRGDDWKTSKKVLDVYGLDPFLTMPAIRVEKSGKLESGQYIVPQPFYLLARASLGIFYLLGDKEKEIALAEGKPGRNAFRDAFGDVYREYVSRQLNLAQKPILFIDIDKEIQTDLKKPDFALIKDEVCVLFEVKTSFLTLKPRIMFDASAAKAEMGDGKSFKKAFDQLNTFEQSILKNEFSDKRLKGIKKVVKVIVGFEDLYLANSFLLPIAKELYGTASSGLQIATLADIEAIGTKLSLGADVVGMISEKISVPETIEWSLAMFVSKKAEAVQGENPVLKKAYEDFFSRVAGKNYSKEDPLIDPPAQTT
jgi:hypothetical protein